MKEWSSDELICNVGWITTHKALQVMMEENNNLCLSKKEIAFIGVLSFITLVAAIGFLSVFVFGSSLSLEPPPKPNLFINGSTLDLTADDKDRDISIDPTATLPVPNGTQTIPTTGATDVDINEFPPIGVTVMIQNDSITVTRNQVSIEDPTFDIAADESSDDSSSSSDSSSSDSDSDEE